VRANVVCREFARVGLEKVPDAKVLAKIAKLIGPQVVEQIHRRIVELAKQKKAAKGRRMRLDTTVVETNIHYVTLGSDKGRGAGPDGRVLEAKSVEMMSSNQTGYSGRGPACRA
jgi:IS5 family transposase